MASGKDDGTALAPKVGAAAFGVALTLPLGLAGPADAMNVCACGGGGAPPKAEEPPAPGPTSTPAPTPPVDRAPSPPPEQRVSEPAPRPEPRPQARPEREPRPQPRPEPQARPEPRPQPEPESGVDHLVEELTSSEPQSPPPARNLEELMLPPSVREPERPAATEPRPGPRPQRRSEPEPAPRPEPRPQPKSDVDRLVEELTSSEPQPQERPDPQPRPQERPEPETGVDHLIEELTSTKPQSPPPPEYLSDLLLPGVDLADTPPPDYEQPRGPVGTPPSRPPGQPKPGQSFMDHYLETLTGPPPAEPEPIADPPDLRHLDPIAQDEFILSPLTTPFYSEADRRAARDRREHDELVLDGVISPEDDRNPERNEFRMEHAEPEPPPPAAEPEPSGLDTFQGWLDWGGFAPGVGAVPDLINGGIYAMRGKWDEAAWSLGGAVPFAGDAAKGARKGKQALEALDNASDVARAVDNVADARRVATPGSAQAATDNFIDSRPKIDGSDESRAALDAIFARTASGTRANASHPGKFNPVHTRGHSAELRTLDDLAKRSDVDSILPVPAVRGSRTPDFVVTNARGEHVRVEVTTVTGAPRGRVDRGIGSAAPPTEADVVGAITRKTSTSGSKPNQFQADLGDVPKGGTLAVHLRGGGTAEMADAAVRQSAGNLRSSGVNSVEIYTADRQVLRYTRQADGTYSR